MLLFAAEDAGHIVRNRLEGIAWAAQTRFESLDIAIIDTPVMRLDHGDDRRRLVETVAIVKPGLVILDPLVRLHGVDENAAGDVAPILSFLRDLQRRFETAVLLVHHARKSAAARPGQALRGSSDLHAWGDTNLYLRRKRSRIFMTVEHRAAPGLDDIELELVEHARGPALRLCQSPPDDSEPQPQSPQRRILQVLARTDRPLSGREIRRRAATRPGTVAKVLNRLVGERRVEHAPGGYRIARAAPRETAREKAADGGEPSPDLFADNG